MARTRARNPKVWLVCAALAFGASSCVLGLETPAAGPKLARPEDVHEEPSPRPKDCDDACRWSPGYWHWEGGGYVWVEGRWERG